MRSRRGPATVSGESVPTLDHWPWAGKVGDGCRSGSQETPAVVPAIPGVDTRERTDPVLTPALLAPAVVLRAHR
ncbi:hypothetical protein GCM10023162_00100 [Klenkia terrae]